MPKEYKIKWRDMDAQKLSKAVRNFNQKRRRLIAKNPELEKYLPEAKSIRTLKREIKTRRTFNQTITLKSILSSNANISSPNFPNSCLRAIL